MLGIREMILGLPGMLLGLTFHEFAHAYAAYRSGDPTASYSGRLTLNPFPHIDPLGFLALFLFGFGWAKPVPVNPALMRKPKEGMLFVSIAGPFANFLLAVAIALLFRLGYRGLFNDGLSFMLQFAVLINLVLAFFNLIPVPPLDGSKILFSLVNVRPETQIFLERTGPLFLLFLIMFSRLSGLDLLGTVVGYPVVFIGRVLLGQGYGAF